MIRIVLLPISLGLLAAACGGTPPTDASASRTEPSRATTAPVAAVDPVVQWNAALLRIVRTPGAQSPTVHPTRSFAIMHAAIYDAVNAIDRTHAAYLVRLTGIAPGASQDAAAATAAYEVLVALYPSFGTQLQDELQGSLARVPDGPSKAEGMRVGAEVAVRMLALRRDDGSTVAPTPYAFGTRPGDYRSTPPNFPPQPQFTHWGRVAPFALRRASQFRPGRPPALASRSYADDVEEIRTVGSAIASRATADEASTGRFWNGPIQDYWNEIAQTAAQSHHLTTAESARLFALLDLTIADGVIAFYDAKYTYNVWRPVTAVRDADADRNHATAGDSAWLPLVGGTPPDPSYPGAHAVVSAAGAAVLASFFGTDRLDLTVTSEVLPGVERSFETLSDVEREATLSRIFAGVHFRFDLTAGERLGRDVAAFVVDRLLTPVRSLPADVRPLAPIVGTRFASLAGAAR
jgi:hypothetical protein